VVADLHDDFIDDDFIVGALLVASACAVVA
jgi:hypothetical protein